MGRRLTGVRVVFDTCAGRTVGVGHLVRCRALAALLRKSGAHISWSPQAGPRPDVLVVSRDDVSADRLRAHRRRWPGVPIVALDYYGPPVDGVEAVINLNAGRRSRWPRRSRPRLFFEGLRYATLRPAFSRRSNRRAPRAGAGRQRVVVGFGGTDATGWTRPALNALAPLLGSSVTADVVTGRQSAERVRRLLSACDLAVIGGGTMMIEAAALGTPALVVPRTNAERLFAREFVSAGAVRLVPARRAFAGSLTRSASRLLADRRVRARMSRGGRALVDGRGAERVAIVIRSVAGKAR